MISYNDGLTTLEGLTSLTTVSGGPEASTGGLIITENRSLASLDGLESLTTINHDIRIDRNRSLQDLSGLAAVDTVLSLHISNNRQLTSLSGLNGLTTVRGDLILSSNASLPDVDGLGSLRSVERDVRIENNPLLVNVDGLAHLDVIEQGGLSILDNPNLVRCAVGLGPILLDAQSDPNAIGGPITFGENDPEGDCNAAEDVLAAYLALDTDEPSRSTAAPLAAYPNPAAVPATLAFALAAPNEATLVVYDALGREVARPHDGPASGEVTARLPALPAGLYVARLTTADGREEAVRLTVLR